MAEGQRFTYVIQDEAYEFTAEQINTMFEEIVKTRPDPPSTDETHCDYSFLRKDWCAHCLGHVLDPDLEGLIFE